MAVEGRMMVSVVQCETCPFFLVVRHGGGGCAYQVNLVSSTFSYLFRHQKKQTVQNKQTTNKTSSKPNLFCFTNDGGSPLKKKGWKKCGFKLRR